MKKNWKNILIGVLALFSLGKCIQSYKRSMEIDELSSTVETQDTMISLMSRQIELNNTYIAIKDSMINELNTTVLKQDSFVNTMLRQMERVKIYLSMFH